MPSVRIRLPTQELREGLDRIREELHVPARFPPALEAEAELEAREAPRPATDRTAIPLVTVDPPGSRDLDQAFFAERRPGRAYRIRYAIADVGGFVRPGDDVDQEAWRRGQTLFLPDRKAPLYPRVLSEGAASLLPDEHRPAVLWTIDLDRYGQPTTWHVERAMVRSRAATTYGRVQEELNRGTAAEPFELLREVGSLRAARERERGGISLDLPVQEVVRRKGGYRFRTESQLPVERWNAQISLLTGHCAARMMVEAGRGILRTVPPVDDRGIGKLRRVARALGIDWPEGTPLGDVVKRCDNGTAVGAAFLTQTAHVLRGATYEVLDGRPEAPPVHGGLGMVYAHVTAPIRRLADRYANEVALAIAADRPTPPAVASALPALPEAMAKADHRSDAVEAAVINLAEALVMTGREGEVFPAMVVDLSHEKATTQVSDPPVTVRISPDGRRLGEDLHVRLVSADATARRVILEPV